MKNIFIIIFFLIFIPFSANGKTVLLKNGMKMNAEKVWEENGQIKCLINGLIVNFPKDEIKNIISEDMAETKSVPIPDQPEKNAVFDINSERKRLILKGKALDKEFKKMMSENKVLSIEKRYFESKNKMAVFNKKIILYNEHVKRYEQKRNEYAAEVRAFDRWMEKTSIIKHIDKEILSTIARSWIGRDIGSFIGQWGNPDKIIKQSDKNSRYIFNLDISPSNIVTISFTADPTGKILNFKTEKK